MNISEAERIKIVAFSLFFVGWGRNVLAGTGFFYLLGRWKLEVFFLCLFLLFLSWHKKRRQKKVKPPQGAFSLFIVGRGRATLTGIDFFYLLRRWELKMFRHRYFYTIRDGLVDMSARYFSRKLWGRMRYAPTLTDEKGAVSLFVGGRGIAALAGMGFTESLGR